MKNIVIAFLIAATCLAAATPTVTLPFYDGSGNMQYVCTANLTTGKSGSWLSSDSTLTSLVVTSNAAVATTATAHGLWIGARVTLSASSTAGLDGVYQVVAVGSSTTFTLTTSGVSDNTYTTSISTGSPRTNTPVWQLTVLIYDSTSKMIASYTAQTSVCDDRVKF